MRNSFHIATTRAVSNSSTVSEYIFPLLKREGLGVFTYSNGNKYTGKWEEGKKHGKGTYTYASGSIYEGEFKYGAMNGQGIFTWYNGTKRVGEFRKGKLWNITEYGKKGDILRKWVNGVKVVDKRKEQFLYLRKDNGKWLWSEKGNEKNDGIYFLSLIHI